MSLLDQASWVMVPSQYKEDTVRAFKPTSELGNLAFTRSSDATFTDSTGVVRRSPWNLAPYSEQFDNAAWSKFSNGTGLVPVVTPNDAIAPNGTLTADKVVLNTGAGTTTSDQSTISWSTTALTGLTVTWSVYLRGSVGGEQVLLGQQDGGYGPLITLTTEWQRYTRTAVVATGTRAFSFGVRQGIYGTINSTATIYAWGAQVVEGTEALPYFATTDRLNVPRLDYRNADGTLSTCPRLLLEPQRTNSIRNSSMVGAVAGSPGTLPTNWGISAAAGLTQTVVGTGTENGLPYIDLRLSGTATSTAYVYRLETTTSISAANGQTWTYAIYAKSISGTIADPRLVIFERTSAGGSVIDGNQAYTPTSVLQRFAFTRTLSGGATVAAVMPGLYFFLTIGQSYDFTIRIAAPQMELGTYATTWVPTTTTAVTRTSDTFTRTNIFTNDLLSSAGGTWFVDLSNTSEQIRAASTGWTLAVSGTTYIEIRNTSTALTRLSIRFIVNSVSVGGYTLLSNTSKIAINWNGTTGNIFVNGVKVINGAAFNATELDTLTGGGAGTRFELNQSLLVPYPLTDSECIALTTL